MAKKLDLTDITFVDADGEEYEPGNAITLQILNPSGSYGTTYQYSKLFNSGWNVQDGDDIEPGQVLLEPGQAFCVANGLAGSGDEIYFRISGEVDLVCLDKIENVDYSLWGNSTPVRFDLTELRIVDESGEGYETGNALTIQILKPTGSYSTTYQHSLLFNSGWNIDGEDIEAGTVFVEPGQAFCVFNGVIEDLGDSHLYFKLPVPVK